MLKVAKFGGSSMADAGQYQKIRDIIRSDPSRRVVVVSAAGKRSAGDNKITDLLYLCYAHLQYGVSCDGIYQMIRERYGDIHRELGLRVDLEGVLDRLRSQMEQGISRDELVSRGEYLSALLMADYLGFTFVDAAQWLFFHYDGTIDQEKSYAALRALARDKCVVIPGFYGLMPDGKLRTLTRGGSDITGARWPRRRWMRMSTKTGRMSPAFSWPIPVLSIIRAPSSARPTASCASFPTAARRCCMK